MELFYRTQQYTDCCIVWDWSLVPGLYPGEVLGNIVYYIILYILNLLSCRYYPGTTTTTKCATRMVVGRAVVSVERQRHVEVACLGGGGGGGRRNRKEAFFLRACVRVRVCLRVRVRVHVFVLSPVSL